jgi:hypothetical protein
MIPTSPGVACGQATRAGRHAAIHLAMSVRCQEQGQSPPVHVCKFLQQGWAAPAGRPAGGGPQVPPAGVQVQPAPDSFMKQQLPPAHSSPSAQAVAQVPQCRGERKTSTQEPLQQRLPTPHGVSVS